MIIIAVPFSLSPLVRLMDRWGNPTKYHLPRSSRKKYDSSWWFHSRAHEYMDGMVMAQKIWGDQKTFVDAAESLMDMVLKEGTDSCVLTWSSTFIFYRDNSINNPKTAKRGSENGHEFRNMKTDHNIQYISGGNLCPIPREAQREARWKDNLCNHRRLLQWRLLYRNDNQARAKVDERRGKYQSVSPWTTCSSCKIQSC